jgi:hypothetical protein
MGKLDKVLGKLRISEEMHGGLSKITAETGLTYGQVMRRCLQCGLVLYQEGGMEALWRVAGAARVGP